VSGKQGESSRSMLLSSMPKKSVKAEIVSSSQLAHCFAIFVRKWRLDIAPLIEVLSSNGFDHGLKKSEKKAIPY